MWCGDCISKSPCARCHGACVARVKRCPRTAEDRELQGATEATQLLEHRSGGRVTSPTWGRVGVKVPPSIISLNQAECAVSLHLLQTGSASPHAPALGEYLRCIQGGRCVGRHPTLQSTLGLLCAPNPSPKGPQRWALRTKPGAFTSGQCQKPCS